MTPPRRPGSAVAAAAVLALLLAALAGGCAKRARDNPLDPRNRTTHGMLVGFDALASDGVVELRWPILTLDGVEGYHVQRWRPGGTPLLLPGAIFPATVGATEDFDVANDSTYVYRLIAVFATGDSAASAPDTATPGTLRLAALTIDPPGYAALTADARDLFYTIASKDAYDDVALDPVRGWFWLSHYDLDAVERRRFDGTTVGPTIDVLGPSTLSVSTQRGLAWVTRYDVGQVVSFLPDTTQPTSAATVSVAGQHPVAVATDNANATVWVGTQEGLVVQASSGDGTHRNSWQLPGGVVAIAVDEAADAAWVASHSAPNLFDLYYVVAGDPDPGTPVTTGRIGVVDLAVDPATRSLWVSERGAPGAGSGRLTRVALGGQIQATLTGIEPYGLSLDPATGTCWVADLESDRLLEVSPAGVVLRRSALLGGPYRLVTYRP
ncbi:MAG: hypothetical protein ACM3JJ_03185 [Hyphomicrobiales bacterium]